MKENSVRGQAVFNNIEAKLHIEIRTMTENWWNKKAEEIKKFGERNNSQGLYSALKTVYDPKTNTVAPVKNADGTQLLTDTKEIPDRWKSIFTNC